jgi:lysophospholipase L1-like esterase
LEVNLVLANLFSIACQAQYHNIAPIIGTPLPFHTGLLESSDQSAPVGGYEKCLQKLTDLVQRLADSAAQYDIPCIDYHQLLCDDQGQANAKYYLEDGLHLNKQGHRLMAQETVRCLKKVFCFF